MALSQPKTGVPAGVVEPFAMETLPNGWIHCNGAAISRTTYSKLFAAIGTDYGVGDGSTTFNIPDLRGQFVRGWAAGGSLDSGRSLGSDQSDQNKLHGHPYRHSTWSGQDGYTGGLTTSGSDISRSAYTGGVSSSAGQQIGGSGGGESRPTNVAMKYAIKY